MYFLCNPGGAGCLATPHRFATTVGRAIVLLLLSCVLCTSFLTMATPALTSRSVRSRLAWSGGGACAAVQESLYISYDLTAPLRLADSCCGQVRWWHPITSSSADGRCRLPTSARLHLTAPKTPYDSDIDDNGTIRVQSCDGTEVYSSSRWDLHVNIDLVSLYSWQTRGGRDEIYEDKYIFFDLLITRNYSCRLVSTLTTTSNSVGSRSIVSFTRVLNPK